jgi:hypothetical protein
VVVDEEGGDAAFACTDGACDADEHGEAVMACACRGATKLFWWGKIVCHRATKLHRRGKLGAVIIVHRNLAQTRAGPTVLWFSDL